MHNERDGVCAIGCHKTISQGDTDENGQRYTQQWGAETVGCISNDMIANDWVIGGSSTTVEGLMYSLSSISPQPRVRVLLYVIR